jgi:hypothetical protein
LKNFFKENIIFLKKNYFNIYFCFFWFPGGTKTSGANRIRQHNREIKLDKTGINWIEPELSPD